MFLMRLLLTFLIIFLGFQFAHAQVPKDVTVALTATITVSPASVTLTWPNPGNANLLLLRRTKGQAGNAWIQLIGLTGSNVNSVTDNGVASGQIYEYVIQQTVNGLNAFGYAHVAINGNPVNSRGKILIFVDSTTADALGPELARLKNDMRGDGWWPIPFHTGPSSTVQSIKNQIITSYNADPTNVKAVLLLGSVPIPYSGDANWDGHTEHAGAWPSDAYYADVNGVWTDVSINDVTPSRAANVNIPGDGKFDQSFIPSAVELQVGRVDFRRINAPAFGAADANGLMKRYLDKNHKWRIGDYPVENKALVDDNFGYFGGEAFAENGYRNAYPLVGEANVVATDFFGNSNPQSFLLGYGTGGGTYQSADGVGSSADFAVDSVNIVFSNLFGSYHGDWDFETNPFMPSALASRGGILTCSWAGRPHWFNQYLASGETIGYCTKETMNAQFNNGFFGSVGESGAHVALLGDPTLRAHAMKPATNLTVAELNCHAVELNWTASTDASGGYHIYRGLAQDGPYTRLTATPITALTYTDNAAPLDTLYYQVRAIKSVSCPGGGTYSNNAIGPIKSIVFTGVGGPTVTTTGGTLNCLVTSVTLTASPSAPVSTWNWTGPNNFSSSLQNPSVTNVGTYTVTAIDATGCSSTATAVVNSDYTAPNITADVSNALDCANTSATITVSSAGLSSCTITGPGNLFVQGFTATVTVAGTYSITVVSSINGCLGNSSVLVASDSNVPLAVASNDGPISCANPTALLSASTNVPGATFTWSGPCLTGNIASCPGVYTVVVTNTANGCTGSANTTVESDLNLPTVAAQAGTITCNNPIVDLDATWSPSTATVQWTGPCVVPGIPAQASCPGVYTVIVTNINNGCTASVSVNVTEDTQGPNINFPPPPPLSCAVPCYVFTAPNLPGLEIYYQGQLIPAGTTIEFCQAGTYVISIKSVATGCSKEVDLVVTQDLTIPIANAEVFDTISCATPVVQLLSFGSSSGADYHLIWYGPSGFPYLQPNPLVNFAGVYTLTVTNLSNGCTATASVEVIADPSLPTVNATASGELNCATTTVQLQNGNDDPTATFFWVGPNGFISVLPNPDVSAPGVYSLSVEIGTCTITDLVEVVKAPDLVVNALPNAITCDGIIGACVQAEGGTPPYTYQWSNGSTENCATYVGSSTIGVSVTDAGGCSFENTQTVVVPPPMAIVLQIVSDCNGNSVACPSVSGGTPPYAYNWSNGSAESCATLSGSGSFALSVTDAAGCVASANFVITLPPVMVLTFAVVHESAPNANNGSIDLSAFGGTGPYQYLWNTGATTQDLTGLTGGVYTVTTTDVNGCTKTVSVTVNTTVGTEEAALFEQFLLSPNPTEGLASLSLKLHEAAALRVEIRDVAGRLVWEKPMLETAALDLPIDLTHSSAGMYTVSVWVGNQVFVRKLAVVR